MHLHLAGVIGLVDVFEFDDGFIVCCTGYNSNFAQSSTAEYGKNAGRNGFGRRSLVVRPVDNSQPVDDLIAFIQSRKHFGVNAVGDAGLDLYRLSVCCLATAVACKHIDGVNTG